MNPDDPRHGSHAGAIVHWRARETPCDPCATAARRYSKRLRVDHERGNRRRIPLGQTAWHIIHTTPRDQLSRATGITGHKLSTYHTNGPETVVITATKARILEAGAREFWTPVGIQRRLQALTALGWSMRELADRAGADIDGLKRLRRREDPQFVCRPIAEVVINLYSELHMTPAPPSRSATKTRNEAIRRRYVTPLAWDDIDRDPLPRGARDVERRDLLTEWADLEAAGESIDQAATRLGVTVGAIERALYRARKKECA